MRLYTFCTPSHEILLNQWLIRSLKDDYELHIERYAQKSLPADYMSDGWIDTMLDKVEVIIRAIRENEGKIFIHSDADVQFFGRTQGVILKAIDRLDMVIQRDTIMGSVCAGFFAARGNEKNLLLWQNIREGLLKQKEKNDQDLLNDALLYRDRYTSKKARGMAHACKHLLHACNDALLRKCPVSINMNWHANAFKIKWAYLPMSFFSPGVVVRRFWQSGESFYVPEDIVIHHANWTVGIENKMAQLKYVKDIVDERRSACVKNSQDQ